jgi:hypothetical protein
MHKVVVGGDKRYQFLRVKSGVEHVAVVASICAKNHYHALMIHSRGSQRHPQFLVGILRVGVEACIRNVRLG